MLTISKQQARQFILSKQGLIGAYRFIGKEGAYDYICQAGCIQFDPVDVCGIDDPTQLYRSDWEEISNFIVNKPIDMKKIYLQKARL